MSFFASSRRAMAFAVALAAGTVTVVAPNAMAAPDGSNVVINEVYGGGGNTGAAYTHDFVELYNPTDAPIDVTGWVIDQQSAAGNSGKNPLTLSGTIAPKSYYLIQGAAGNTPKADLPAPDAEANFNFAGVNAVAELTNAAGDVVDLVGWGTATKFEGAAAAATTNSTSVQRVTVGLDTDNNAVDFQVAAPTPMNSGSTGGDTGTGDTDGDTGSQDPLPNDQITAIAYIQGTTDESPMVGQTVTTRGIVTGVYAEGGMNGYFLQTGGTGAELQQPGDASHGIFVYLGSNGSFPEIGQSLEVTGTVGEYYNVTQLSNITNTILLSEPLEPVTPAKITHLAAGEENREIYESMLVQPTGAYTVTNNYGLNRYGELGLAVGTEAYRTPTDVVLPGAPAQEMLAEFENEVVLLDDGRTRDYTRNDQSTPLPYIHTADGGIKTIRTGDGVTFQNPVVVHYSFNEWRFQPQTPVTGNSNLADLPISWAESRTAELAVPASVQGDFSLASFNVLNYFTSLGKDEAGCRYYTDMYGNPVATNYCNVRGAYSAEAFNDQQTKIVNAINMLDVSVLGLEEIENTYALTGNIADRDNALNALVEALNTAAGTPDKWAAVESPAQVGTDEDVIRVAFIYQPAKVKPVGESRIFDDAIFTGTARQPLAQEFAPTDGGESFVAIVNHFKSKGSVANGDEDMGDGQGNNANLRVSQSQALLDALNKQEDWADKPVFVIGDLNAYSKEDAVRVFEQAGYTNVNTTKAGDEPSYQFDGQLGSLDHVLANEAALALVQDAAVWNINADEPIAFEYSRRNYNAIDFYDTTPFRSSDHDPIKVGFNLNTEVTPEEPETPAEPTVRGIESAEINAAGELILTYTDGKTENLGKVTGADGTNGTNGTDGRGIKNIEINAAGQLVVTFSDGKVQELGVVVGKDGQDGTNGTNGEDGKDGRSVQSLTFDENGNLVVTFSDGTSQTVGKVTGEKGEQGDKGEKGDTGATGRGIESAEFNDEGELVLTYTDGTTQTVGKVVQQPAPGSSLSSGTSSAGNLLAAVAGIAGIGGIIAAIVYTFFPNAAKQLLSSFFRF